MASSKWMMPMLSPSSSLLDEDPGIMSEAETSSTGLVRRNSRQRSSLPVVRTPSKTLERPLGLVFLQYRNETKRGLLPNEITTLDTVRALFVRSFANHLSMEYFDSHNVRIYIHDPGQDVFYELEDLRDIRDRCILRLHESDEMKAYDPARRAGPSLQSQQPQQQQQQPGIARLAPGYPAHPASGSWNDLSYFSEPEFDSGYRQQHVHTKSPPAAASAAIVQQKPRYTLQRSTTMMEQSSSPPRYDRPSLSLGETSRNYSMDASFDQPDDDDGAMMMMMDTVVDQREMAASPFGIVATSQPIPIGNSSRRPSAAHSAPDHPFRHPAAPASPAPYNLAITAPKIYTTPSSPSPYSRSVFDMEYAGPPAVRNNLAHPAMYRNGSLSSSASNATDSASSVDEQTRIRMEQVERQLASLTGLVQTALTTAVPDKSSATHSPPPPPPPPPPQQQQQQQSTAHRSGAEKDAAPNAAAANDKVSTDTVHLLTVTDPRSRKTMKEKCVSFEKSVSFCDDPIDVNEGKHTPQPTESRPAKPAIKSSTLPRASSQVTLSRGDSVTSVVSNVEMYTQLRLMQKTARELRAEIRQLRRLSIVQSSAVSDAVKETILVVKKTFLNHGDIITASMGGGGSGGGGKDQSIIETSIRSIRQEEDDYHKDMQLLDKDISELETLVENLRGHVINKKMRVSMAEVEKLAVLLSQSSKTIDSLNTRYPPLEESVRSILTYQMERLVEEKRFLTEEPSKMEAMMRRCKKLTSTLVTLRRLASVQEQRKPDSVQEKSMVPKNSYTVPAPIPLNEPFTNQQQQAPPLPPLTTTTTTTVSTGAQRELEDGADKPADVHHASLQRQQGADGAPAPAPVAASVGADPSAAATRAGTDAPASGQSEGGQQRHPAGPAASPPALRVEQQGSDNPIDLLLNELKQVDIQVGGPSANQPSCVQTNQLSSAYLSLNLTECYAPDGASRRRRTSPPPPPPARTSSSLKHPVGGLIGTAAKFGSEPSNVYPSATGKEMVYYYYAHQPQYYYYNHNHHAYHCSMAQPSMVYLSHSTSETAINRSPETPCPVHPHRQRERARTQENLTESASRQIALETRRQELLLTQKRLQERYAQVQQWKANRSVPMGVSGLRHAASSAGTKSQLSESSNIPQETSNSEPSSGPSAVDESENQPEDDQQQHGSVKEVHIIKDTEAKPVGSSHETSESNLISYLLNESAIETDIL